MFGLIPSGALPSPHSSWFSFCSFSLSSSAFCGLCQSSVLKLPVLEPVHQRWERDWGILEGPQEDDSRLCLAPVFSVLCG